MRIEVHPEAREELLEFLRRANCETRVEDDGSVTVEVPDAARRGPGAARGRAVPQGVAGQPPRRRSARDPVAKSLRGSRPAPSRPIERGRCAVSSPSLPPGSHSSSPARPPPRSGPQKGMSGVLLGMTKAQVQAKLGRPIGTGGGRYFYARVWVGFRLGRVVEITTTRSTERTAIGGRRRLDARLSRAPRLPERGVRPVRRFPAVPSRQREARNARDRLPARARHGAAGLGPAAAGLIALLQGRVP